MFLFIPVRLIIAPAFSASESGNLLSAAKLTVNSPELHSTGGRISAVDLELNLLKRLANGGSIIARNLALNTPDITNSGLIYGEAGYQVRVDNLSNSGTLSSPAKIDIAALHDRLDIHNSGNILARQTEVTADSLYGAGTVSGAEWAKVNVGSLGGGQSVTAGEHLELNVASDVDNHGTLGAAGQADINIPNLNNHGRVLAGEVLNLSTGQLNNAADGLINTSGATNIQASSIDNLGRLYGDWVNLNASYLKNHGGGAIAAREHLDARINTIDNLRESADGDSPIIKSDGTMTLTGSRLTNAGATLQSAGRMVLNGMEVKNENPFFSTHQVTYQRGQGKKYLRSLDPGSDGKMYDRDLFTLGRNNIFYSKDSSKTGGIKEINHASEITVDVKEERTEVASSTPGQILVGGGIDLNHSNIYNDKSVVTIDGVINRNGGDIHNSDKDINATSQFFYNGDYNNSQQRKNSWRNPIRRAREGRTDRIPLGNNPHGELHESDAKTDINLPIATFNENQKPELREHNSAASSDVGASDGGLQRIESGGYVTIEGVAQQLPSSKLFNSAANNRDYLVQTDPDYIGGVVADVPAWRGPTAAQTAAGSSANNNKTPATGNRFDQVGANLAEHLQNRLNHIEGGLASINPADAPQNGVNFGVDERKIAALAPYTPSGIDPHDLHKRMGDIYAEMENLRRQYALQTGRGELPGEGDPIERYKALLNSGAEIIQRLGLTPGVALTAEQMQQLTGDTVIPVNRTIRLADGSTQQVTTLQLYSKKRAGDIDGRMTHISAEHITGKGGKLENHAIFNARGTNDATFSQVNNQGGTIQARDLHMQSEGDINNTAGTLRGRRSIDIKSGGKITNAATETAAHSTGNDAMRRSEQRLREGQVILDGEGQESEGYLRLHAKGDIEAKAGSIENRNDGSKTILSGANIRFGTQRTDESFTYNGGGESRVGAPARDSLYTRNARDHGGTIKGKGDIILDAREGKITGRGADIDSSDGHVALFARDGIDLQNSWRDSESSYSDYKKSSRLFGSKTNERYIQESEHRREAGSITGTKVSLIAGRDMSGENTNGNAKITLGGMHVVSDKGTLLKATGDITLNPAEETYRQTSNSYQRKSGLFYSLNNPLTLSIERRQWDNRQTTHGTTYAPSLVGALDGNVVIDSDGHYQNNGSIVHASRKAELEPLLSKKALDDMTPEARQAYWEKRMAAGGNVLVRAKSGAESAMIGQHYQNGEQKYKSSGLKLGLQGGFADGINAAAGNLATLKESDNARVQAMAAGLTIWNLHNSMQALQQNGLSGAAQDLRLSLGYSKTRSESQTSSDWQSVHRAQTSADGSVIMQIRGKGEGSTYTNTASDIGGGDRTVFDVEGKKTFNALETAQHLRNENRNKESHLGASFSKFGPDINGGGGKGGGYYQGNGSEQHLAHIGTLSGHTYLGTGELTEEGAQIFGRSVSGTTRNLRMVSPQASGTERGQQYQFNSDLSLGSSGVGGSIDGSYARINGEYRTTNATSGARTATAEGKDARSETLAGNIQHNNNVYNAIHAWRSGQNGIFAGEDGYQIDNIGTATIHGSIITSSDAAEAAGLNSFSTDRLQLEDIDNYSKSSGFGVTGGLSYNKRAGEDGQIGRSLGGAKSGEEQRNKAYAAINTKNITIRDREGQQALTGMNVEETIARANAHAYGSDAQNQGGATTTAQNGQHTLQQLSLEANTTREFGKAAPQIINKIAESQGNLREYEQQQLAKAAAEEALTRTSDPAKRAALQNYINERDSYLAANKANYDYWKEGGSGRNLLHAASTALMSGTPEGALAGYTTSALSPTLNKLDNPLLNTVGGAAIGAAIGGNNPAVIAGAANTDWHNRQLHPTEMMLIEKNARTFAKQQGISEEEAISLLVGETLRGVSDDYADIKENQAARTFINQLPEAGKITNNGQHLFGVLDRESDEYRNSLYNIQHVEPNAKLYKQAPIVNNGFKDSTDYTLWLATYDDKNAYKKAGKEEVLGLYAGLEKRINDYRQKADELAYNNENGDEEQFKKAHEYIRNASTLHEATSANYPNASSLFTLAEFYNRDTAYSRIATGNIAESAGTSAISGGVRALNSAVNAARKIHPYRTTQETAGEIIKNKVLENIEISKQARESSNFTKYAENEVEFIEATNAKAIYPDRITFPSNLKNHLANVDGFKQNIGIKGGHNMNNFLSELSARNGAVVSKTPIADGIFEIKYKIPRLDRAGKPDGSYKIIKDPKTVYDPAKFSDEQMLKMAQEAAAKRYNEAIVNGWDQYSATVNGVTFRIYLDKSGAIRNVHPGQ